MSEVDSFGVFMLNAVNYLRDKKKHVSMEELMAKFSAIYITDQRFTNHPRVGIKDDQFFYVPKHKITNLIQYITNWFPFGINLHDLLDSRAGILNEVAAAVNDETLVVIRTDDSIDPDISKEPETVMVYPAPQDGREYLLADRPSPTDGTLSDDLKSIWDTIEMPKNTTHITNALLEAGHECVPDRVTVIATAKVKPPKKMRTRTVKKVTNTHLVGQLDWLK